MDAGIGGRVDFGVAGIDAKINVRSSHRWNGNMKISNITETRENLIKSNAQYHLTPQETPDSAISLLLFLLQSTFDAVHDV